MSVGTDDHVVVVGAGQAGAELAASLRVAGYTGALTLVGSEPTLPYMRPPLSKAYLLGESRADQILVRDAAMYEQQNITLRLGVTVTEIDRAARAVLLDNGERLEYSSLVLATGGSPRRLPAAELDAAQNVFYVRTLGDVDALRERLVAGSRLAVVGGGYIGLEIASVARSYGLDVTVIEAQPRVLARVTSAPVSEFVQELHRSHGVEIIVGAQIDGYAIGDDGDVSAVRLTDGSTVQADLLLVGIGLLPGATLAQEAGLTVDNGVVVDEFLRTEDPDIYAIGDVARYPHPQYGRCRLESVPNASAQARALARTLTGLVEPFSETPWFWSDQYDVKLQTVGLIAGHDDLVVRTGGDDPRRFAAFYLRSGVLIAADIASNPREFAFAKRLVADRLPIDRADLANPGRSIKDIYERAHDRAREDVLVGAAAEGVR
jgi:3-phenylpropionate/trans-cinnamate dioxygenase ferredoxin reductase subunit